MTLRPQKWGDSDRKLPNALPFTAIGAFLQREVSKPTTTSTGLGPANTTIAAIRTGAPIQVDDRHLGDQPRSQSRTQRSRARNRWAVSGAGSGVAGRGLNTITG